MTLSKLPNIAVSPSAKTEMRVPAFTKFFKEFGVRSLKYLPLC